jgi:hypothetical protein
MTKRKKPSTTNRLSSRWKMVKDFDPMEIEKEPDPGTQPTQKPTGQLKSPHAPSTLNNRINRINRNNPPTDPILKIAHPTTDKTTDKANWFFAICQHPQGGCWRT